MASRGPVRRLPGGGGGGRPFGKHNNNTVWRNLPKANLSTHRGAIHFAMKAGFRLLEHPFSRKVHASM